MIGKLSTWYKENVSESADCWACRLISGFGMMGIGAFLLAQAKRRNRPFENYTMKSLAAAAGFLGAARLADANFLKPAQPENKMPTASRKIEDPLGPYARR
ncbi:uncharacterized protein Dwil_GK13494 [Drosophila willistoni]|uniref:Distal membrane-arm assembly complex protein 1-like domain-containing protein n=1 Tax=Drosophila willistoni TaxID=7260 RepID=B4NIR2_DROWI|nr:uncharacterized protein LOC6650728 [Drosophila willistoni]EDW83776.2 uncharacterized protein Dwil_GK13494 [Drosophila willistoni]